MDSAGVWVTALGGSRRREPLCASGGMEVSQATSQGSLAKGLGFRLEV